MDRDNLDHAFKTVIPFTEDFQQRPVYKADSVTTKPGGLEGIVEDRYNVIIPASSAPLKQHKHFMPPTKSVYSIFTAGSIEMGAAVKWQDYLADQLRDLPITVQNPRRGLWVPNDSFRTALTFTPTLTVDGNAPIESRTEHEFEVENNKFVFTPDQLRKLDDPKSLAASRALDGLVGLDHGLCTDKRNGAGADIVLRGRVLICLTAAAAIALAIGILDTCGGKFEDFSLLLFGVGMPFIAVAVCTLWVACRGWQSKTRKTPAEPLPSQPRIVPAKTLATSSHGRPCSTPLARLLPCLFFAPSYAQPVGKPQNGHEMDWQQRARGALTNNLVTFAFLLFPAIVSAFLGFLAHLCHSNAHEGAAFFGMLGTGVVFVAISKPADAGVSENDYYMRIAIGVAYLLFVAVFCRLIAIRQRWYKGRCAIAAGTAIFLTLIAMSIPQIRSCWLQAAKLDPLFAILLGMPMSFALCDLVVYVVRKFGGGGGVRVSEDDRQLGRGGGAGEPEQAAIPSPVPGPART
ncbi:hypothetical protein DE146DRAFT_331270 [Phaeosphaeria sp. MPI-PUGE-AT-0046c]|nr:hypothetical protein DE146DRAFT_331270 [Phaeosphaeria sp. MPI-PUGE-AT-0046c]